MKPKALVSWSSGKDSAFALHKVRASGEFEIVGVITTITSLADFFDITYYILNIRDRGFDSRGGDDPVMFETNSVFGEIYNSKSKLGNKGKEQ